MGATHVTKATTEQSSLATYTTGFILSLVLTLGAYFSVTQHLFNGSILVVAIVSMALLQFFVQLFFFLHLGREKGTRWNLILVSFMMTVVLIVVFGSLWIMHNLDYHMQLTPEEQDNYMQIQNQKGF
ncbi:MAG: putative cytochrome ubiquinol oxidase chain cyoD [Candidatus Saccharibacteria bacterium]|nr:putative cytochrome ubiquinol oxidase chain cyoD [Candidatus Saccharibacteria bacterium]